MPIEKIVDTSFAIPEIEAYNKIKDMNDCYTIIIDPK